MTTPTLFVISNRYLLSGLLLLSALCLYLISILIEKIRKSKRDNSEVEK